MILEMIDLDVFVQGDVWRIFTMGFITISNKNIWDLGGYFSSFFQASWPSKSKVSNDLKSIIEYNVGMK